MKVVTAAGHDMILEVDVEGNVLVGGVKLMLRDKMTTNGVIHVIGKKEQLVCSGLSANPGPLLRRGDCSPGCAQCGGPAQSHPR